MCGHSDEGNPISGGRYAFFFLACNVLIGLINWLSSVNQHTLTCKNDCKILNKCQSYILFILLLQN